MLVGEKLYPSLRTLTSGEGQNALASCQALDSQHFRPTVYLKGRFMVGCFSPSAFQSPRVNSESHKNHIDRTIAKEIIILCPPRPVNQLISRRILQ